MLDGSIYEVKWKNIQANVSLPNCAYNFVDNLADATSRGVDFAFQLKATESLEFDGAVGYNDPKFDPRRPVAGRRKIFSKGAGIPDAGAPLTVSLSGEYVLALTSGYQGYLRTDFTHTSEWRRVGNLDPNSPLYDPRLLPVPAYNVVNMRLGARFSGFDVSLFVQNLTDSQPWLDLFAGSYYDPQDWSTSTLRPRTYGLTFTCEIEASQIFGIGHSAQRSIMRASMKLSPALLIVCAALLPPAASAAPDRTFVNGKIFTANPLQPLCRGGVHPATARCSPWAIAMTWRPVSAAMRKSSIWAARPCCPA